MKRFLYLLLPLAALCACQAAGRRDNATLLWKVSGNGLQAPSYLFGTIHLICPGDYLWTPVMKQSLAACKQVCFELDMDDPATLQQASGGFMDTSGRQLRSYFRPEQYARLRQFMLDSAGADIDQMQMMKPVVLETLLMSKVVDCTFPVSYEANIMEEAQRQKMPVRGLEDVQEQLDVFKSIPDDSLVASLLRMPDSFSQSRRDYAALVSTYKKQDLPRLYELILASKELDDNMGVFLDDRNKRWVPRVAAMAKATPTFFAVGAGHLWGKAGVIELLRKAGYTVTPVY